MEKKQKYRWTRIELLVIFTACTVRIGWEYHLTLEYQRQQEALRAVVEAGERAGEDEGEEQGRVETKDGGSSEKAGTALQESLAVEEETEEKTPVILGKYTTLHEENADMVGWLAIPGTAIDYPVMQKTGNEYYLHHDFYGEENRHGCLFVKDIAM